MITPIIIEHKIDALHEEHWQFWLNETSMQFMLTEYHQLERATKRHKFTVKQRWVRNMRNRTTMEKPTVPAEIAAQVLPMFMSRLTVEGQE